VAVIGGQPRGKRARRSGRGQPIKPGHITARLCGPGVEVVVEGRGSNGCEYMTEYTAVILDPIRDNFTAGMSGSMAFVYDQAGQFPRYVNPDTDSNF
jgi:hypothetical protein